MIEIVEMAGRPAAVGREKLHEVFDLFKDNIVELNCVVKPSARIWIELHEKYFQNLKAKAIYSAALRWWTLVTEKNDSNESVGHSKDFSDLSMETNADASSFNNSTILETKTPRINFAIYLSNQVWKTVK